MDEEEYQDGQYDLDSIIAEFREPSGDMPPPPPPEEPPEPAETIEPIEPENAEEPPEPMKSIEPEGTCRRLVMRSMGDAFRADGVPPPEEDFPPEEPEPEPEPEPERPRRPTEREIRRMVEEDESGRGEPLSEDADGEAGEEEPGGARGAAEGEKNRRKLSPLTVAMALLALWRQRRAAGARRAPAEEPNPEEEIPPEPEPKKAVRFYSAQLGSLRLRGQISTGLCILMIYLSVAFDSPALPLTGALGNGVRALSLLLMVLELTVMIVGLDVFSGGLLAIPKRRMGAETLVSVSCILSLLDGAVLAYLNEPEYGIPFCAVSAISLCCAIWGAYYTCKGRRTGFRVLASSQSLYAVTLERELLQDNTALLKTRGPAEGFIRRSEEADYSEYVYGTLTPFLLAGAVVLGAVAAAIGGNAKLALHCISILAAAGTTFSCAICFALPFSAVAGKLQQSGAAIAGWSGLRDVGEGRYVVVTDTDLFPRGTTEVENVRILEGFFADKVISYTGSVLEASGSGLAIPFGEMLRRKGYTIRKVDSFSAHDGGGMAGVINGETVLVGGAAFMNLMGIRLPQKLVTKSTIFTAINGELVGLFEVRYRAVSSVQGALVLLLNSKQEPLFAIRDFNITPQLIKERFRLPQVNLKFPTYAERYRVSGALPAEDSRIAAVVVRDGMAPMAEIADRGRHAYRGIRLATLFSAFASVGGLAVTFLLCTTGAFDSVTASNVLLFLLAMLFPQGIAVISVLR